MVSFSLWSITVFEIIILGFVLPLQNTGEIKAQRNLNYMSHLYAWLLLCQLYSFVWSVKWQNVHLNVSNSIIHVTIATPTSTRKGSIKTKNTLFSLLQNCLNDYNIFRTRVSFYSLTCARRSSNASLFIIGYLYYRHIRLALSRVMHYLVYFWTTPHFRLS